MGVLVDRFDEHDGAGFLERVSHESQQFPRSRSSRRFSSKSAAVVHWWRRLQDQGLG